MKKKNVIMLLGVVSLLAVSGQSIKAEEVDSPSLEKTVNQDETMVNDGEDSDVLKKEEKTEGNVKENKTELKDKNSIGSNDTHDISNTQDTSDTHETYNTQETYNTSETHEIDNTDKIHEELDEVSDYYKNKFMPYIENTFDIVDKNDDTIKYKIKGDTSDKVYEIKNYENILKEQNKNKEAQNKINEDDIQENFLTNSIYAESSFAINNYIVWQNTKMYDVPYFNMVSRNRDFNIRDLKVGNTEKNFQHTQMVSTSPIVKYPYISFGLRDTDVVIYSKDENNNKSVGTIDLLIKRNSDEEKSGKLYKVTKNNNSLMNYYFLSNYSTLKEFVDDFYNKEDFSDLSNKGNAIFENLLDYDYTVSKSYKPIFYYSGKTSPALRYLYIKDNYNPNQKYISPEKLFKFTKERLQYLQSRFNEDRDYAVTFLLSKKDVLGDELYNKLSHQLKYAKNSVELSNILTREVYRNLINNATKDIDFEDYSILLPDNFTYDKTIDKFDRININASLEYSPKGINGFIFTKTERDELQKKLPEFRDYYSPISDEIIDVYVDNTMKFHKEFTNKEELMKFIKDNLKGYEGVDYTGANLLHQITGRYWYNLNVGNTVKEIALENTERQANRLNNRLGKIENIASETKETIEDLISVLKNKKNAIIYLKDIENRINKIEEINSKDSLTPDQKATWSDILIKELDYNSVSNEINDFIKALDHIKKVGGENERNKVTLLNNTYFKNRKQKKSLDSILKREDIQSLPIINEMVIPLNFAPTEASNEVDISNIPKPRRKVLDDSLTPLGDEVVEMTNVNEKVESITTEPNKITDKSVQTDETKLEEKTTKDNSTQTENSDIDKTSNADNTYETQETNKTLNIDNTYNKYKTYNTLNTYETQNTQTTYKTQEISKISEPQEVNKTYIISNIQNKDENNKIDKQKNDQTKINEEKIELNSFESNTHNDIDLQKNNKIDKTQETQKTYKISNTYDTSNTYEMKNKSISNPKTSDNTNLSLNMFLTILSIASGFVAFTKKYKK